MERGCSSGIYSKANLCCLKGNRPNGQVREMAAWTITTKPESSRLPKVSSSIGSITEASTGIAINWVLGAVEQETGRCQLQMVANRDTATLDPILERWLLPGTHIISDGWAAYNHLDHSTKVSTSMTWLFMSGTSMTPSIIGCIPTQSREHGCGPNRNFSINMGHPEPSFHPIWMSSYVATI